MKCGPVCKVFYQGNHGVVAFDKRKIIFQQKEDTTPIRLGVGMVDMSTLVDKDNYAFASMCNIEITAPADYGTPEFWLGKGFPKQLLEGEYGDSILYKEVYRNTDIIRAYNKTGEVMLFEAKNILKNKTEIRATNGYYLKLDNAVGTWTDVTEFWLGEILKNLNEKKCTVNMQSEYVNSLLHGHIANKQYTLAGGAVIIERKYESMAIWEASGTIYTVWLGRIISEEYCASLIK